MKKRKKLRWKRIIIVFAPVLLIVLMFIFVVNAINQPVHHEPQKGTENPLKNWTLKEQIGQLIMVGTPANTLDSATENIISQNDVGSVFLTGRSDLTNEQVKQNMIALNDKTKKAKLLIAVDQEGGQIQVLQGSGFSAMPDGLTQGQMSTTELEKSATNWGNELKSADVNMNLAPVSDLVPSADFASENAPIGYWNRQYGYDVQAITSSAAAFAQGMKNSDVLATAKHFPGIGRVTENTDFSSNVTDDTTTSSDDSVQIFKNLIAKNIPAIMTSTVIYDKIDANNPAAFSPTIVTDLLRKKLDFKGLIVTDDLSNAAQVQNYTVGNRAVLAIAAGNDLICAGAPEQIPEMTAALYQKAQKDRNFNQKIATAAERVIEQKTKMGLIKK